MYFTVDVEGLGLISAIYEDFMDVGFYLQKAFVNKENELTDLKSNIIIFSTDDKNEVTPIYEGTLEDFITPATFQLNVSGQPEIIFHDRDTMDNYIRNLVNEHHYAIKTPISIIDSGKTGNFINQFVGEIWHYLDDWNLEMMGAPKILN